MHVPLLNASADATRNLAPARLSLPFTTTTTTVTVTVSERNMQSDFEQMLAQAGGRGQGEASVPDKYVTFQTFHTSTP